MHPAIAKKLLGKGGAFITRQYLRDAKSINPIKRIKALRALSKASRLDFQTETKG